MPLEKRELSYLWDMQNAANEIHEFMHGVKFGQFEKDKVKRYAAERLLLIIGEAANHLSPQFRKKHPEIEWAVFIHSFAISWLMSMEKVCSLGCGLLQQKACPTC